MCVKQMPFFLPESTIGEFDAQGVLGLAPSFDGRSFVENLYNTGEIKQQIVGLNFEDLANRDAVSTITFGYWDYNSI